MKKFLSTLLIASLLLGCCSAFAQTASSPKFSLFANDIFFFSSTYYPDYDYLFYHSTTAGSNLNERLVYSDSDNAVFVTHGGDTTVQFFYEKQNDSFVINKCIFTSLTTKSSNTDEMLNALVVLASALKLVKINMFTGAANDKDFLNHITTEDSFSFNGSAISQSFVRMGQDTLFVVTFDNLKVSLK